MKTPNPDNPIRNTLTHLALALTLGAALYFGAAPASAAPPVTSDLKLHLDASQLGLNDNDPVSTWTDMSGLGNNATAAGAPIFKAGVLNGQPVVRFDNASSFTTADLSAQFGGPLPDPYPTAANSGSEGASIDGAYINTPTRGVTGALVGDSDTAASFNGSNQNVRIPWSAALNPATAGLSDPFTVEAWVKSNGAPTGNHVIIQSMRQPGQLGTVNDIPNDRSGWFLREVGTNLVFAVGTATGAPFYYYYTVAGVVSATNWQHVVVVYDGDETPVIYVDKVAQAYVVTRQDGLAFNEGEEAAIRVRQNTDCPEIIGDRAYGGWVFNGVIDEVAIYPSALSAAAIEAHFDNGVAAEPATPYATLVGSSSPVGYYRLDEPAAPPATQAATGFIVTTIDNDNAYTLVKANPGVDEWWRYDGNGRSYPGFFRGNRLEDYCDMPTSGSQLFAITSSPSAWEMSINGISQGVAGANYNPGAALVIGNGSSGGGLNGDIAEVLIYNRVLTAEESEQVGAYLATKYGVSTTYGPPTILSYTPPDDSTTATTADLVATFNKPIAIGTGNITIKNLTASLDTRVITLPDSQVTISGAVLTINPTDDLVEGNEYAVQIDAGAIASFAGILDDTTWNFTAAAATPTTTTVVSSLSPTTYGDSVTFTATVDPIPSGGTVQFYNGIAYVGTPVAVNTTTGEATVTTSMLGVVGPNEITAEYSGNFQFAGSTSAPISQVVDKAELTVTAQNVFRFQNTANPDPLPYEITGYQNGEDFASSGVSGVPILSTDAVPESPGGTYDIICDVTTLPGMSADNYSFTPANGILTVVDPATPFGINVNLDNTVRAGLEGPAGGLGAVWNTIQAPYLVYPFSYPNLRLASGIASTVSMTIINGLVWGTNSWGSPSLGMLQEGGFNFDNGPTNSQQFVINGLDPAKTYDLYIASANMEPSQRSNGVWSTPNTTTTPGDHPCSNVAELNGSTWVEANNYVLFRAVVPDGTGKITIDGRSIPIPPRNYSLPLSGFQLVEVPPATIKSFGTNVAGSSAVIGVPVAGVATIDWTVPYASGSTPELLAALAPEFTLSSGTCTDQSSGVAPVPGFDAGSVTYTVTDDTTDPDTTNVYTVTVTVAPPPPPAYRWNGADGGNWTDVANWNNTVPGAADIAILSDSDTAGATATLDADAAVAGLTFNNLVADQVIASPDGKTLTLASGASLTVEGTHSISANVDITLGKKLGSGSVNLSGTVAVHGAGIAMFVSDGVLGISGPTTFDPASRMRVDGSATLEVTGVLNTAGTLFPVGSGDSTATATVILKDSGQWNQTHTTGGDVAIGISGANNGRLIIQDTAQLNSAFMVLGFFGPGTGTVQQDGGTVTLVTTPEYYTALARPALWIGVTGPADYHLNGGTLKCGTIGGTGKLYLNGGTLVANMDDLIIVDPTGALSTAVGQDSFMQGLNQVVVQSGALIDTAGHIITIAQNLEHDTDGPAIDGGLTKQGPGTLTLLGTNTYTGPTKVQGGTLACATAASVAPTALEIDATAMVDLTYTGNQNIPSLKIGVNVKGPGVYGSSSSPAPLANQDDVHFAGTGTVTVGGSSGFTSWAAANAGGQTPDQDHDNDGVENGIEYFMGETGSSFTAMPGLDATNTVSWPASAAYQGTYEVQTSTDLGTWTNVDPRPPIVSGFLSYTLPADAPGGKSFVRLLVTPAP